MLNPQIYLDGFLILGVGLVQQISQIGTQRV